MKFLVMTDVEGVTGVTTFPQAEKSDFGKRMLMNDVTAVLAGLRDAGAEAVLYDMHTDGRNLDVEQLDCPVVMGKPILPHLWRGVGGKGFDGLFMVGLHTMQNVPGALLAHSYLREYASIHINGVLMGEIGVEAALAGEQGVPLKFVSGDDLGCKEASALIPGVVTAPVKTSLADDAALCLTPAETAPLLREAARRAAAASVAPFTLSPPYEIRVRFSPCRCLEAMKTLHPDLFETAETAVMRGENLLETWSAYLLYEREMIRSCQ